jgi:hypothetical protein
MLSVKTAPRDLMKTVFCNAKGIFWFFARILSFGMGFAMSATFRASGAIPVYRNERIADTYSKTFETMREGLDVVIFPDSLVRNPENEFIDVMQKGAFKTFKLCVAETGSAPGVFPAYCCKSLNTVCFGNPLVFDTELPPYEAMQKLEREVGAEIKRLALTLPPHKVTHYAATPKNVSRVRKYLEGGENKIYDRVEEQQKNVAVNASETAAAAAANVPVTVVSDSASEAANASVAVNVFEADSAEAIAENVSEAVNASETAYAVASNFDSALDGEDLDFVAESDLASVAADISDKD